MYNMWCLAAASWWADCRWHHCCCQAHITLAVTGKVSLSVPDSHASSSLKTTTSTHSWCLASDTSIYVLASSLSRVATALTAWTLTKGCYLNWFLPEVSPLIIKVQCTVSTLLVSKENQLNLLYLYEEVLGERCISWIGFTHSLPQ